MKVLSGKSYGSIPHLPGSRTGSGDYHINDGQARIATEKKRDEHDWIIVQEKLDGSNAAVARLNGEIVALTRSGHLARSSEFIQYHYFDIWVQQNISRFNTLLKEGERVCGEWLAMCIGTQYHLTHEPFVPFDIISGKRRATYYDFAARVSRLDFTLPKVLSIGDPMSIEKAIEAISVSGHGAIDPVEGAIWRVERKEEVDFLCKFVHHFKQDGKYMDQNIWHWKPD